MRRLPAASLAFLALAVAGCANADASTNAAVAPGNEITVSMTEFAFDPTPMAATAGLVRFHAVNDGAVPHQLALSRLGEEHDTHLLDTGDVTAGDRKTVEIELPPGNYEIACHVAGHFEAGMVTTLTVVG